MIILLCSDVKRTTALVVDYEKDELGDNLKTLSSVEVEPSRPVSAVESPIPRLNSICHKHMIDPSNALMLKMVINNQVHMLLHLQHV